MVRYAFLGLSRTVARYASRRRRHYDEERPHIALDYDTPSKTLTL